ncbi:hypothetical protein Tco_0676066, partial [Tanacetum coccineum]
MNQLLERVDQSPFDNSMIKALDLVIEALVAKELLGHPNMDVNISDLSWNTSSVVLMMEDIMIDMMDKRDTSELLNLALESAMKECEIEWDRWSMTLEQVACACCSVRMRQVAHGSRTGAIYHTEVCIEGCAGAIYPIKVVSRARRRDKEVNMAAGESDDTLVCCGLYYGFWCIVPCYLLQGRVRKVQATLR